MINSFEEIYNVLDAHYIPIQRRYNFISLGGSIPLILCKFIPFRPIKDIDIISTQYISKAEIKNEVYGLPIYEINDNLIKFDKKQYMSICNKSFTDGVGLDIFINPKATYYYIQYKDMKLRISPPEEIISFKIKRGLNISKTCDTDLKNLFNNI